MGGVIATCAALASPKTFEVIRISPKTVVEGGIVGEPGTVTVYWNTRRLFQCLKHDVKLYVVDE